MSPAMATQPTPPDDGAEVVSASKAAMQALAVLFDAVNQKAPDSPIAGAVQDLMKATSEVKRHIMTVGPDLEEGTEDDATGSVDTPAEPGMEEGMPPMDEGGAPMDDMGVPPEGEMAPEMEAPVDPGPMGPGPMNAAGRGMNAALLEAAKRKQPQL